MPDERRSTLEQPNSTLPRTVLKNVELIAQVEQQLNAHMDGAEQLSVTIARFFGSFSFITVQGLVIVIWILLNTGLVPWVPAFDPYPYGLLSLLVGIEFILLTTFVLMNQAHQMRRTEQWALLTLQMSLLSEQESTKSIELLHQVCRRLGLHEPVHDPEGKELARPTDVAALVEQLNQALESPKDTAPPKDSGPEINDTAADQPGEGRQQESADSR